ncbi:MAG: hypothetical protein IKS31_11595, partial [Clostridia bacterium]|nr:hypothetical protein [Clostridia bacterium]
TDVLTQTLTDVLKLSVTDVLKPYTAAPDRSESPLVRPQAHTLFNGIIYQINLKRFALCGARQGLSDRPWTLRDRLFLLVVG